MHIYGSPRDHRISILNVVCHDDRMSIHGKKLVLFVKSCIAIINRIYNMQSLSVLLSKLKEPKACLAVWALDSSNVPFVGFC